MVGYLRQRNKTGCSLHPEPLSLTPEMARDKPRLLAALKVASAAMAKVCTQQEGSRWDREESKVMILSDLVSLWLQEEEVGGEQDALDLYQHSLGELLLLLAGEVPITTFPEPLLAYPYHVPSLSLQRSPQAVGGSYFTLRYSLGLGGLGGFIFPFDAVSIRETSGSLGVFQVWESDLTDLICWWSHAFHQAQVLRSGQWDRKSLRTQQQKVG